MVTDCLISEMKGIGILATDGAEIISLKHCAATKCNLQGLLVFNEAKMAKVLDSHFENNNIKSASIMLKGCSALIKRTPVKVRNYSGILIEDGRGHFDKVVIEDCVIGMTVRANVEIKNCINNCSLLGIQILNIAKGEVVLENNKITKCFNEIARISDAPLPIFKGKYKNDIITLAPTDVERENLFKKVRKSQRKSAKGTNKGLIEIECEHCGLQGEHF